MVALPPWVRPVPYVLLGPLVGFLFLAELGLMTSLVVQFALLALAVAGLAGVVRRVRSLELWPLFVAGAIPIPLVVDSHVVGLPRCAEVARGVACLASSRDVAGEFAAELMTLVIALAAIVLLIVREARRL